MILWKYTEKNLEWKNVMQKITFLEVISNHIKRERKHLYSYTTYKLIHKIKQENSNQTLKVFKNTVKTLKSATYKNQANFLGLVNFLKLQNEVLFSIDKEISWLLHMKTEHKLQNRIYLTNTQVNNLLIPLNHLIIRSIISLLLTIPIWIFKSCAIQLN